MLRYNLHMVKSRYAGKQVGVLGLGREGIEVVRFMVREGASVTVLDAATPKQLANYDLANKLGVTFQLGSRYKDNWEELDIIVRSPGVPLDMPELRKASKKGVVITSSIKIFFELCPAKIIGITGSKGKSTTTSLIYLMLTERGRKVWLGGNIGASPLPALAKIKLEDWVVLELSSFQLEDLTVSPHIAVLLEVVPEHLDRHKTFAKYLAAKQNIYSHQKKNDWLITSIDFATSRRAIRGSIARVIEVSLKHVLRRGVYIDRGEVIFRDLKSGRRLGIMNVEDSPLTGKHNWHNVLPALACVIAAGVDPVKAAKRMMKFEPLAHRLQLVREVSGVKFIDDTLATTPEAAEAAILAFPELPKAVILGGVSGGGDWGPVVKTIGLGGVEYVALIGSTSKKLKLALKKSAPKVQTEIWPTFNGAVKASYKAVKGGGVVLLSPGAKSFDMFKDAYDRGEKFTQIVKAL